MPRSPRRSRSPDYRHSPYRDGRSSTKKSDERRSSRYEELPARDRDRERERDAPRERERDRDRERDKDRNRGDRYRQEDDDRRRRDDRGRGRDHGRRDDYRSNGTERERTPPLPVKSAHLRSPERPLAGSLSPKPTLEDLKKVSQKERLAAWKRAQELKAKGSPAPGSPTPEPPASIDPPKGFAALPSKPAPFSLPAKSLSRFGLPLKPSLAPVKRALATLDDEAAPDRKLLKLDLPEMDPQVQSGDSAQVGAVSEDLDVVDGDDNEDDLVPSIKKEEKIQVDEEEEEDPLDAFMRSNTDQVKIVNQEDKKRMGLNDEEEEEEETEVKNKLEEELASKEALLAMAASKSRKKDLPAPDHDSIDYEPFKKNFYSAPMEVEDMTDEETELLRLVMDGIKIRGTGAPKPVFNWGAFGLPTGCIDIIKKNGWEKPTPIQAQSIPAIMSGRDVIGVARTGSGKTISFLLPLFRHIKYQRPLNGGEGPIAIIMAPTRELAMQIFKEAKPFMKVLNLKAACCYGGSPISEDISSLKKGAEVVVCTPGRMIDLLTANSGRVTNLRRVTYLTLDEADRMFDMGFQPQIMKIIQNIRPDAQKVFFSATFPKEIESLVMGIYKNKTERPLEITVGGRSVVAAEIDQRVKVIDQDQKFDELLRILGDIGVETKETEDFRTLIFVDRQEGADDLFRELLQKGYVCASLHGGKDQVDRDEAITNFKNGDVPIIVATSVAARGLDVKELKLVLNYDCPNHMEDYVHRAGRTGRAGNKGTCITFITPDQEKFSVDIVRAMQASNAFVPPDMLEMSNSFLAKIKSGKAKAAGNGFSGKGLERLERKRDEKDRAEKSTYGDTSEALSLSSREGAVIPYKPKGSETTSTKEHAHKGGDADYTFTEIRVDIINGPAPDKLPSGPSVRSSNNNLSVTNANIERARKEGKHELADRLAKVAAAMTESIRKQTELTKADKFGLAIGVNAPRTKDPDATDWHAIFPINDYPQKARWKATNKEQMTLLQEISGASITNKGIFYPPGEEPLPGAEPKLSLLIESNEEHRVRLAVDELRRVLVEASLGALNNADRAGASGGRYNV
ncbi:ATP-dependent RNA helicase DDX46/PRP5, partial [Tremellales sp. Uapishka_1]